MKTILTISIALLMLTSCRTYIDYQYLGYNKVEYTDTLVFQPIHSHWINNKGEYECLWIDGFKIHYTQYYVIEYWVPKKRYTFKRK